LGRRGNFQGWLGGVIPGVGRRPGKAAQDVETNGEKKLDKCMRVTWEELKAEGVYRCHGNGAGGVGSTREGLWGNGDLVKIEKKGWCSNKTGKQAMYAGVSAAKVQKGILAMKSNPEYSKGENTGEELLEGLMVMEGNRRG